MKNKILILGILTLISTNSIAGWAKYRDKIINGVKDSFQNHSEDEDYTQNYIDDSYNDYYENDEYDSGDEYDETDEDYYDNDDYENNYDNSDEYDDGYYYD